MSLRLFADQCAPSEIVTLLAGAGHHVILVREVMHHAAPDRAVISKAQELDSILISLNGDFADIVEFSSTALQGSHRHSAPQPSRDNSDRNETTARLYC